MNTRTKTAAIVGLVAALALAASWQLGWAQEALDDPFFVPPQPSYDDSLSDAPPGDNDLDLTFSTGPQQVTPSSGFVRPTFNSAGRPPSYARDTNALKKQIAEKAAAVRDAEGREQKRDASAELQSLLEKVFDHDLQQREKEIAEIEERVNKLRAQLDRRAEHKSEIIGLQMMVAINEAKGLGFFRDSQVREFSLPNVDLPTVPTYQRAILAPARPISAPPRPVPANEAPRR